MGLLNVYWVFDGFSRFQKSLGYVKVLTSGATNPKAEENNSPRGWRGVEKGGGVLTHGSLSREDVSRGEGKESLP